LNVRLILPQAGRLEFRLLDVAGRAVRSYELGEKVMGEQIFLLNMGDLGNGVYFLEGALAGRELAVEKILLY
jgi:hypothetical protein